MIGEYGMSSVEIMNQIRSLLFQEAILEYGVPYLDDALLGLFPKELVLIGARSGGGKTELATQILLTQMPRAKRVMYFALDHDVGEIERRLMWRRIVATIRKNRPSELYGMYLRYAEWQAGKYDDIIRSIVDSHEMRINHLLDHSEAKFIYQKGRYTGEDIARIIAANGETKEYSLVIIDHFHALKLNGNPLEAQSRAIRALAKAAEIAEIPVVIMGQFRKGSPTVKSPLPVMDEFSGSSDLIYIPNTIVVFGPKVNEGGNRYETYFHVVKARAASDAKPFVGIHSFDIEANTYSPRYSVARHIPFGTPADITEPNDMPKWAKRTACQSAISSAPRKETWVDKIERHEV